MKDELKSILQLGKIQKDIELHKELTITLHTLSVLEQQRVMEKLPANDTTEVAKFVHLQRLSLIEATDKINGMDVTIEESEEFYNALQYSVLAEAFTKYSLLAEDQDKVLTELKKK